MTFAIYTLFLLLFQKILFNLNTINWNYSLAPTLVVLLAFFSLFKADKIYFIIFHYNLVVYIIFFIKFLIFTVS